MTTERELVAPIRLIVSDVDGVLTDGSITYDSQGFEIKTFHVRDGMGVKLWQRAGYRFAILTSRNSQIVKQRAAEIGVETVRQGSEDKREGLLDILRQLRVAADQTAYIGDDLPDLAPMRLVALPIAVSDAALDVRRVARWTTRLAGGRGAVREAIERMLIAKGQWEEFLS
jgi:YrbI family 3-deoxy-D-manno-octulosonate 8-phosphate phosphatase